VPAAQYGMSADIPLEMLVTVTFEEHEGKTTLTLQHVGIPADAERDGLCRLEPIFGQAR
jgi:Activator of Hsp90 ATPase homolog 1-like protein